MSKVLPDSDFVWVDVSTFDVKEANRFYSAVFGWKYRDKDGYNYAHIGSKSVSGMFEMPEFLQKMNMPSFWMSYISVIDIKAVVARAKKIKGVIVEIEPFEFAGGQAALIRDPSGAGFTVYEGPDITAKDSDGRHGMVVWNELIVDSADTVIPFYEKVFGFELKKDTRYPTERYIIKNQAGKEIAGIEVLDESARGDKKYWLPFFGVASIDNFSALVEKNGGHEAYRDESPFGKTGIFYDTQEAAFAVVETGRGSGFSLRHGFKIKTLLALVIISTAIVTNTMWVWGVLFLLWLIPDLKSGSTYLVEPVTRSTNPILYWLTMLFWLGLSLYFFSDLL